MNVPTPPSPALNRNVESSQPLTRATRTEPGDRPAHGAQHPAPGTIEAPIVVVGATGTIGKALVRQLVASGQPVVAVAPRSERLVTVRDAAGAGAVTSIVGRIENDGDAKLLADRLRELGRPLAGVVVAFPYGRSAEVAAERGRVLDQATRDLCDCLEQTVLAQHALARRLIPLLTESGRNATYVIVGGPGSEAPWAGYGHRSIAMAATRMLARVLHDEARPFGVRVQLLSIDGPVRGDQPAAHECPEWPTASDIARRALRLFDRTAAEESTKAIVARERGVAARTPAHEGRTFSDVPSFLASLRNPTKRITPQ